MDFMCKAVWDKYASIRTGIHSIARITWALSLTFVVRINGNWWDVEPAMRVKPANGK